MVRDGVDKVQCFFLYKIVILFGLLFPILYVATLALERLWNSHQQSCKLFNEQCGRAGFMVEVSACAIQKMFSHLTHRIHRPPHSLSKWIEFDKWLPYYDQQTRWASPGVNHHSPCTAYSRHNWEKVGAMTAMKNWLGQLQPESYMFQHAIFNVS